MPGAADIAKSTVALQPSLQYFIVGSNQIGIAVLIQVAQHDRFRGSRQAVQQTT